MSFPLDLTDAIVNKFINDKVKTYDDAIVGAKYIISEWISDNAYYRRWIRNFIYNNGTIVSEKKKKATDDTMIYEIYYDYSDKIKSLKPHRILAVNRAEKEDVITVKIDVNDEKIIEFLEKKNIKNNDSFCAPYIKETIEDSYKRLIFPSVQREIRSDLTEKVDEAINELYEEGKVDEIPAKYGLEDMLVK